MWHPLKYFIFLGVLIFQLNSALSQNTIVEYFFGTPNFINENQELVLIVKEPQSPLAVDIGNRYYENTPSIDSIQNNLALTIDTTIERIYDLCGFDMFFYLKSGRNIKLINKLNSNCTPNFLTPKNIDLLKKGSQLIIDTLGSEDISKMSLNEIFNPNVIYAHHEFTSYNAGNFYNLQNSMAYPLWFYEGQFEVEINSNFDISVVQNVIQFLEKKGVKNVSYSNINWVLKNEQRRRLNIFENEPKPNSDTLNLTIYISKEYFNLFEKSEVIETNISQKKIPPLLRYKISNTTIH